MSNDIHNVKDYQDYCERFAEGVKGLEDGNFSTGYWNCPSCGYEDWSNCDPCEQCGAKPEEWGEPHFSWSSCHICGGTLGGDRENVIAWLRGAREADWPDTHKWEGQACTDCVYFEAYGRLDDMTMLQVEENANVEST